MRLFPSTSNFRLVETYFLSKSAVFTKKKIFLNWQFIFPQDRKNNQQEGFHLKERFKGGDTSRNLNVTGSYFHINALNSAQTFIWKYRSSRPEVFYKKGVLINFGKLTGKHFLIFLMKLQICSIPPENIRSPRAF